MTTESNPLGGRLPLLNPAALSADQRRLYDRVVQTQVPWADAAGFQSRTADGRLIGPFNPLLYSPAVAEGMFAMREAEAKHTSLTERVRQVVILTVGAVWASAYELYAHEAVARKAGLSEEAARSLAAGGLHDELSEDEQVAQRYTWQLSAEHRVDPDLYAAAEQAFGRQGLVDIAVLAGSYHLTCCLLNGFEVPAPDAGD